MTTSNDTTSLRAFQIPDSLWTRITSAANTNYSGNRSAAVRAALEAAHPPVGSAGSPAETLDVVVGTQYGSEGKGHVTDQTIRLYADAPAPVLSVRVGGPNAGHCVIDPETGHKYAFRSLPVGAIHNTHLLVAAGSELDMAVLLAEIEEVSEQGRPVTLNIDPQVTVLTRDHIRQEQDSDLNARTGSTAKGIGAARADRVWRRAPIVADLYGEDLAPEVAEAAALLDKIRSRVAIGGGVLTHQDTAEYIENIRHTRGGAHVVIEGTQGYGLGLHAGLYPQCTSNDARAIDFLAMAGVNPWDGWDRFQVIGATRTNPIRVAGNSGPLKGETTWEDLGQQSERTTVTQKTRRVGEWDAELVSNAVRHGGVHAIALTMVDKVFPEIAGQAGALPMSELARTYPEVHDFVRQVEKDAGARVAMICTGEATALEVTR